MLDKSSNNCATAESSILIFQDFIEEAFQERGKTLKTFHSTLFDWEEQLPIPNLNAEAQRTIDNSTAMGSGFLESY